MTRVGRRTIQRGYRSTTCLAFLLVPLHIAVAQEPVGGTAPEPPTVEAVRIPKVAARSEELQSALRGVVERIEPAADVMSIQTELGKLRPTLEAEREETRTILDASPSLARLSELERSWTSRGSQLSLWRETVARHAANVEGEIALLDAASEVWQRTLDAARSSQAPEAIIATIRGNLDAISTTRKEVQRRRSELLSLLNAVAQQELAGAEIRGAVGGARDAIRARFFEPDAAPLWAALVEDSKEGSITGRVRERVATELETLAHFFEERRLGLVPVGLVFLTALLGSIALRNRIREEEDTEKLEGSAEIFDRWLSIAAITALMTGFVVFPFAPTIARNLVGAILVVPVLRIVGPVIHESLRPLVYALTSFYLIDRVRDVASSVYVLERALFLVEMLSGVVFLLWLLRPARMASLPEDAERPPAVLGTLLRLATLALVVASLANLFGYMDLSRVLGEGVFQTAYLAVLFFAAHRIGITSLLVALSSSRAQRIGVLRTRSTTIFRSLRSILAIVMGLLWLRTALGFFEIRDVVVAAAASVLTAKLTLGTVALTLGDILSFGATIAVAIFLSRGIRTLLQDELFPRVSLGRGVGNAVTMTTYYVILLAGFFLAIGAAGIDFSRFAILAGAFGVGIGFGLQNVVNNFVSGLILLYERPIQVGDTIEIGGLLGEVKRIGIRASMVRSKNGAEVIVPNGNLISSEVVNWTLSDQHRRVELPIGVAYGNRPSDVIELLKSVVEAEPRALRHPEPKVFFRGFGDSSLDFEVRFWAANYEMYLELASDVGAAAYDALRGAGIEIPFPQRDLHLRSIDPAAARQLTDPSD